MINFEVQMVDGKYVAARLDDEDQATLDWRPPIQPINGNCTIVGVVISAMRLF